MQQAVSSLQAGLWQPEHERAGVRDARTMRRLLVKDISHESATKEKRSYEVYDSVAVLSLHGPMMKAESKFGGTSTLAVRRQLRQASMDPDIRSILLHIDSPGGHVAGTQELADDVDSVRMAGMPVFAYIEDLGASAAYWVGSQAMHVSSNPTGESGSIGTVAILEDRSGKMEREGIQVHVISTGLFKGLGVEGAPITQEGLTYIQHRVDRLNAFFQAALRRGRRFDEQRLARVSDGRMFIAAEARQLGLIDEVMSLEEVMELASISGQRGTPPASTRQKHRALQVLRHRQGV